eukprot:g1341.t1
MQGRHSSSPAPTKSNASEARSEKDTGVVKAKKKTGKKLKSLKKMHSFDRRFKNDKRYKNPDVRDKTPSYMRQTCASLTKINTMKRNSVSPGPESKQKSSLEALPESDDDETQLQENIDEVSTDPDQLTDEFDEEMEDDDAEYSTEEESDPDLHEGEEDEEFEADEDEAKTNSSPLATLHEGTHPTEDSKPEESEKLSISNKVEEKVAEQETQENFNANSVQNSTTQNEEQKECENSVMDKIQGAKTREINIEDLQDLQDLGRHNQGQTTEDQSNTGISEDSKMPQQSPVQTTAPEADLSEHFGFRQRPGKSKSEEQEHVKGNSTEADKEKSKIEIEKTESSTFYTNSTLITLGVGALAGFFGAALLLLGLGLSSKRDS